MTEHEKRIREALEAGPTEREWLIDHRDPRFVYALNVEGYNQFWAHVQGPHTRTFELEANARLIVACNPAAIRALLADLDAVRGALKRLYVAAPTGLECGNFHHSKGEFHRHSEPCKPAVEYVEAIAQAAAALKGATA